MIRLLSGSAATSWFSNALFAGALIALTLGAFGAEPSAQASSIIDSVTFGDAKSEESHGFSSIGSETVAGGLGESARRLLPTEPETWEGGSMKFTLAVDPEKPNYATARFWGSDATRGMLVLFCEGKQIDTGIPARDLGVSRTVRPARSVTGKSPFCGCG